MKRIIAFVFLGLLIYAGGFVIYYSYTDLKINVTVPTDISNIAPGGVHTGLVVGGSVYQVLDEIYTETVQPRLFGIPVGEEIEQHYYVLPLGTSQMYMLIAVSDKRDLEMIERIKTSDPKERDPEAPVLEIIGVAEEIPPVGKLSSLNAEEIPSAGKPSSLNQALLRYYLMSRLDLIGIGNDVFVRPNETLVSGHIVPYTIYVKHPGGADYVPLIVGIATCVVGLGLTALLIVRIQREKEYY